MTQTHLEPANAPAVGWTTRRPDQGQDHQLAFSNDVIEGDCANKCLNGIR